MLLLASPWSPERVFNHHQAAFSLRRLRTNLIWSEPQRRADDWTPNTTEIFKIMCRFRFHEVGLAADVAKMYRQIGLHPEDRDFHRLVWRDDPNKTLSVLRLTRVIYGIRSSAFHAVYALQNVAKAVEDGAVRRAIHDDFYVDDFLGGSSSPRFDKLLRKDILDALSIIQMPIRKWSSNSQEVLDSIPEEDREESTVEVARNECGIKTLGVGWNTRRDVFSFVVPRALKDHKVLTSLPLEVKITRRKLLAAIATVYDPLGWLSPLTVRMKILFQQSWGEATSWNDELAPGTVELFRLWVVDLLKLEYLEIPRKIRERPSGHFKFVLFTDASEQAMTACLYVVDLDAERPTSRLLCAKTRLAAKKMQTVPRLELCAMLLGAKLLNAAIDAVKPLISDPDIDAYTDSTTALTWVKPDTGRWATFVANRVRQITELMDISAWHHVPGEENPADLATRNQSHELPFLDHWWFGPKWITDEIYPNFVQPNLDPELVPDIKRVVLTTYIYDDIGIDVLPIFWASDLGKLLRVTRIVLRVVRRAPEEVTSTRRNARPRPPRPALPLRRRVSSPTRWTHSLAAKSTQTPQPQALGRRHHTPWGAAHALGPQPGRCAPDDPLRTVLLRQDDRSPHPSQALPCRNRSCTRRTTETVLGLALKVHRTKCGAQLRHLCPPQRTARDTAHGRPPSGPCQAFSTLHTYRTRLRRSFHRSSSRQRRGDNEGLHTRIRLLCHEGNPHGGY